MRRSGCLGLGLLSRGAMRLRSMENVEQQVVWVVWTICRWGRGSEES